MKVSLDGGETWMDATEDVRVLYEHGACDVYITLTPEGIITDVWSFGGSEILGEESVTINELVEKIT